MSVSHVAALDRIQPGGSLAGNESMLASVTMSRGSSLPSFGSVDMGLGGAARVPAR
jgi:hypothetical protein